MHTPGPPLQPLAPCAATLSGQRLPPQCWARLARECTAPRREPQTQVTDKPQDLPQKQRSRRGWNRLLLPQQPVETQPSANNRTTTPQPPPSIASSTLSMIPCSRPGADDAALGSHPSHHQRTPTYTMATVAHKSPVTERPRKPKRNGLGRSQGTQSRAFMHAQCTPVQRILTSRKQTKSTQPSDETQGVNGALSSL
jgi:hypothetical protein